MYKMGPRCPTEMGNPWGLSDTLGVTIALYAAKKSITASAHHSATAAASCNANRLVAIALHCPPWKIHALRCGLSLKLFDRFFEKMLKSTSGPLSHSFNIFVAFRTFLFSSFTCVCGTQFSRHCSLFPDLPAPFLLSYSVFDFSFFPYFLFLSRALD